MRFLADENIPGPVVAALRERGDDVFWIRESMPGASDPVILDVAQRDQRVVVTADTDFGELLANTGDHTPSVLLLRRHDRRRVHALAARARTAARAT